MNKIKRQFKNIIANINNLNLKFNEFSCGKYQNKILQFFPRNLYLLILFIILLFVFTPKLLNNEIVKYQTKKNVGFHDEIVGESVEQKINTKGVKEIKRLDIRFATFQRKNNSLYKLEIFEDEKSIYSKKFSSKNLEDLAYYSFDVNITNIKSKSKYKYVVIPIKVKKDEGITILTSKDGELVYRIIARSDFWNETIIFSVLFLVLFFFINYLINNNKIKSEKSFLLVMLIYIIPVLFIYPVYTIPDEPVHFKMALRVSQYDIFKTSYENMVSKKMKFPDNYKCLSYYKIAVMDDNTMLDKDKFIDCFKSGKTVKINLKGVRSNKQLSYIPAAIGIKIMDYFSNSPMLIFYAGRLFNFIFSLLVLLYAFKVIPKYKKVLLMVIMIPVFIQQMISYSYDSMLNSLCVLIVAYLVKFYNVKDIDKKDLFIFTIASIIVFCIKELYILLILPVLFLSKEKFGNEKYDKIKKLLFMVVSIFLIYYIINYVSSIGMNFFTNLTKVDNRGNSISSVLFDLKHLFNVVYSTLSTCSIFYIESVIGVFGWLTFKFNPLLIYSYILFLALIIISTKNNMNTKFRLSSIAGSMLIILGTFVALYLFWTPAGTLVIDGVQGRYFLPSLLLLMIVLIPKKKKLDIKENTIYSFLNISMVFYVITLLFSFY